MNEAGAERALTGEDYLSEEDEVIVAKILNTDNTGELVDLQERLRPRISTAMADYESGRAPTYASYADILDKLLEKTEGINDEDIEKYRKLAEGRMREIRGAVRRYVEQVAQFQHVKFNLQRDPLRFESRYEAIDASRRRAHDALIETLKTTGQVIAALQEAASNETGSGVELRGYPSHAGRVGGLPVFDRVFLEDRDQVRNWAIAAWTIEQINKAKEKTT